MVTSELRRSRRRTVLETVIPGPERLGDSANYHWFGYFIRNNKDLHCSVEDKLDYPCAPDENFLRVGTGEEKCSLDELGTILVKWLVFLWCSTTNEALLS